MENNLTEIMPSTETEDGFVITLRYNGDEIRLNIKYYQPTFLLSSSFINELTRRTTAMIFASFIPNSDFKINYTVTLPELKLLSILNRHTNIYNASLLKSDVYIPAFTFSVSDKIYKKETLKKTKNVSLFLSGGSDSLCSLGMLQESGYKVTNIFCQPAAAWWFGAFETSKHFEGMKIREDASRLYPFLRKHGNDVRKEMNEILMWSAMALPIVYTTNSNLLLYGDEFTGLRAFQYKKLHHYGYQFEQSQEATNIISDYISNYITNLKVVSIVRPMYPFVIQHTLCKKYPKLYKHQISCETASHKGDKFTNCGSCYKCHRTYLNIRATGGDPSIIGLSIDKIKTRYQLSQLCGMNYLNPLSMIVAITHCLGQDYDPSLSQLEGKLWNTDIDRLNFDTETSDVSFLTKDEFISLYSKALVTDSVSHKYACISKTEYKQFEKLEECYEFLKKNKTKPYFDFNSQKIETKVEEQQNDLWE